MKAAAIYSRVSLPGQVDNYSLASQERAMLQLAKEKGFETPEQFRFSDPGQSGGELDRVALTRLREAVRAGSVQAVVVFDLDRLTRKLSDLLLLTEEIEKRGCELLLCNGSIDSNPEGKLMLAVKGAVAEFERTKIRERVTRGALERARQGHTRRAAYGYSYERKTPTSPGVLRIDEEQAQVVRRIFEMADSGSNIRAIAITLEEEGVPTLNGGPWYASTVGRMLRNSIYAGEAAYNKAFAVEPKRRRLPAAAGRSKMTSTAYRPKSEWVTVSTPVIISAALFARVQERLARTHALTRGRKSTKYLLRGLCKCALCGHAIAFNPNRGRPFGQCIRRIAGRGERLCRTKAIPVPALEQRVIEELCEARCNLGRWWNLALREQERLNAQVRDTGGGRQKLIAEIEKLKRREFRATQGLLDADLSDAAQTFKADLRATQTKRRHLEAQLQDLSPAEPAFFNPVEFCVEALDQLNTNPRAAIEEHVERVTVGADGTIDVKFRFARKTATLGETASYS